MARSRNLKPSFFLDDELAEHNALTRILFAGLWCVADRAGRLRDRPKRVKAEILPYDDFDVDAALNALNETGFIQRYEHDNKQYIQILGFEKHQNPHVKEAASTIPAPESPVLAPVKHPAKTPDSLNPLTDSLIAQNTRFAEWWDCYEKKVDRKRCESKWKRMEWAKLSITPDSLIADVLNRHANCRKWIDGFQPNPLTYLNGERWNDELQKPATGKGQTRIPNDNNGMVEWAKNNGYRNPTNAETYDQFRAYLVSAVTLRKDKAA